MKAAREEVSRIEADMPPARRSLRERVIQSGSWVMAGHLATLALRLGGNLVLTRLLFPEAFGLMAIVQAVILGVTMISDIGTTQAIVQQAQGNTPRFLATAWTLQILRGFLMWVAVALAAPVLADFYGEAALARLLPVAALAAVISGFNSTKLVMASRNLEAARATLIEVGSYGLGLLVMVGLAWQFQSVWALVWGNLVAALAKMAATHLWLPGLGDRLGWDREAAGKLLRFGQWIFLSSAVTFLAGEGNKLLIGAWLDMRQLSFFTLASTMSLLVPQALTQLSARVLFPAYAEVHRSRPEQMRQILARPRLALAGASWLTAALFVFFGDAWMALLYDQRYHDAGPMLQILAISTLAGGLCASYSGVLLAKGMAAANTALLVLQIAVQLAGMALGHHLLGAPGVVLGLAASGWLTYPAYAWVFHRLGLWFPRYDLPLLAASAAVVLAAWPGIAIV